MDFQFAPEGYDADSTMPVDLQYEWGPPEARRILARQETTDNAIVERMR